MCLAYGPDVLLPAGGDDSSVPKSRDDWKRIIRTYVLHYKDLGFTGWYWEVWNEFKVFVGLGDAILRAAAVRGVQADDYFMRATRVWALCSSKCPVKSQGKGKQPKRVKRHPRRRNPEEFAAPLESFRATLDREFGPVKNGLAYSKSC